MDIFDIVFNDLGIETFLKRAGLSAFIWALEAFAHVIFYEYGRVGSMCAISTVFSYFSF